MQFVTELFNLIIVEKKIVCKDFYPFMDTNRGFPKVDHSGRSARIVLEQINSAKKKLPGTEVEPLTLGLSILFTSCLLCLTPVLDPIA